MLCWSMNFDSKAAEIQDDREFWQFRKAFMLLTGHETFN